MNTLERYYNQLAEAGRAVVERRLQLGLSQAGLASEANVDAKTLRSLERGDRWPQDTSRAKVERALGWQEGALQALFDGGAVWKDIDGSDGVAAAELVFLRATPPGERSAGAADLDPVDTAIFGPEIQTPNLAVSELAAMLVTRSQALERRIRELEKQRDELRAQLGAVQSQEEQSDGGESATRVGRDAQSDGVTAGPGERRRRRSSVRRPRLISDDVDEDILELPYAADDSEDPGEDDD